MAMGKKRAQQQPLWIASKELPRTRGHVFYDRVNEILNQENFDEFAEKECVRFYKSETMGRPSIAPGVYFRMLMVGYFEGIDSERGIAWRCADSLSLKSFLGYALTQSTPDHSTVSRTRRLIDLETTLTCLAGCWRYWRDTDWSMGKRSALMERHWRRMRQCDRLFAATPEKATRNF